MNQSCNYNTITINLPIYRIVLSVAYSITAVSAIILNFVVIFSIWRTPSLHKPSYLLLANVSVTDFLVTAIGGTLMVITNAAALEDRIDIFCFAWLGARVVVYWLGSVSLYTLAVISVDRLLAIRLKNRYQSLVTIKRVAITLILWWVGTGILIISVLITKPGVNIVTTFSVLAGILLILLATITVSYSMAFFQLRRLTSSISPHDISTQETASTRSNFNTLKYRRSLNTMLLVFLAIMLFYFPYVCAAATTLVLRTTRQKSDYINYIIYRFITTSELIALINSTINPLLYLWRINDVRKAAMRTIKKLFGQENPVRAEPNELP